MKIATVYKLCTFVILLFLLANPVAASGNSKDTTFTAYWRNGKLKSLKIYSYKRYHDRQQRSFIVLKKLKAEKYYSYKDGSEIDAGDIWLLEQHERHDSVFAARKEDPEAARSEPEHGRILRLDVRGLSLKINLGDSSLYSYEKRDTIIDTLKYTAIVYLKDTLSPLPGARKMLGAFRTTSLEIHYLDLSNKKETAVFDLLALIKELGAPYAEPAAVLLNASFRTASALSGELRSGTEKAAGSLIGNLILIMAR